MVLSGVVTPGLGSEETTLLGGEGTPGRAGLVVVAAGGGVTGGRAGGAGAEVEVEDGGRGVAGGGGAEGTGVLGSCCRLAWRCLGLIFSAAITESWRAEIRSNACNFMTDWGKGRWVATAR